VLQSVLLWVTASFLVGSGYAWAQLLPPASDEIRLRVTQQEFDEDAAGREHSAHAQSLAKQFKISPSMVEQLRSEKLGWGEIAIRLGFAQELKKTNSTAYHSLDEALQKVGALRRQKRTWSDIGQKLGLELAPIVSEVQQARQEMKAQAKKAATESGVTPDQTSKESERPSSQKDKKPTKKSTPCSH
jgi:hypothetical protein